MEKLKQLNSRNRIQYKITIIIGVTAALLLAALAIVGWLASSRAMAINTQSVQYDQTVTSVDGTQYTFTGSAYDITGIAGGIRSDGSYIGVFEVPTNVDTSNQRSTRVLRKLVGGPIHAGDTISLQGNIWTSNPKEALNIDYTNVTYPSLIGGMNAWRIPGANDKTWTIAVHGIGSDKNEMLRFVPAVHAAGDTMLVINYRNDVSNPMATDKRNHLGDTEWQDVESAVTYAQSQGATKIRLYGDSLGGSLVENYLRRSASASAVDRVILDSPALDWGQILRARAVKGGYPSFIYYPTAILLDARANINISHISTRASDIRHKTLIIHSSDDASVPQAFSKQLAAARPDLVTLVDFQHGGHLRSWNNDPARYEQLVTSFLKQ